MPALRSLKVQHTNLSSSLSWALYWWRWYSKAPPQQFHQHSSTNAASIINPSILDHSLNAFKGQMWQVSWPLSITVFKFVKKINSFLKKWFHDTALTKDTFIVDVLNAEPEACWEGADEDVKVKEEGHPGGGLVLRYWCYNGNVDLSIAVDNMEDREKWDITEKAWLGKGREKKRSL